MTQTRKGALKELLAKVEAGGYDTPNFIAVVSKPLMQCRAGEAYRGSLDAALDLHNAVLPGAGWDVYRTSKDPGMIPGLSQHEFAAKVGWGATHRGEADNPARAWLIAILKALIAEYEE